MSKLVKGIVGGIVAIAGIALKSSGLGFLVGIGLSLVGSALRPSPKSGPREASSAALQIGEYPRTALFGRAATEGSLVDAFNYGGTYETDWELLIIALADHRCDALEGVFVNDAYVAFASDGDVAGYSGQLKVWWRSGTESQALPSVVISSGGAGWTTDDNGAGVCYVVVAYKADAADTKTPVWNGNRPRFRWVLRGALCYDARLDSTVAGGAGAHRWSDPATRTWSENVTVCRYTWARGMFACDRVTQPDQLLVGRGLSAVEAPPANVSWRANLCDEVVGGAARYRIGGAMAANETYLAVEEGFAAACAGTIIQPEGAVEIDPGAARSPSFAFTDADLIVGSKVRWQDFLGTGDSEWVNTVVPSYIEPTQKWGPHAAPVRRDVADVIADGGPRELGLSLSLVTNAAQAGRVGEIHRRLGRLPGRGQVTLPPRFAGIEEGDWGTWQSDRYFGGATRTFRVDVWGSDQGWRHQITLRQISSSVYADTAPLSDGAVATNQAPRAAIAAPAAGSWVLAAGVIGGAGVTGPALIVTGASDQSVARFVRIEWVKQAGAPSGATVWSDDGVTGPDVTRRLIAAEPDATYYVAVSYLVDGIQGPRLVLGPVTVGTQSYDWLAVRGTGLPEANATFGDNKLRNGALVLDGAGQVTSWYQSPGSPSVRVAGAAGDPVPAFWRMTRNTADVRANDGLTFGVTGGGQLFLSCAVRSADAAGILGTAQIYEYDATDGLLASPIEFLITSASNVWRDLTLTKTLNAATAKIKVNFGRASFIGGVAPLDIGNFRLAQTEPNADVTLLVSGGRTVSLAYDYTGTVKAGELPIEIPFKAVSGPAGNVTTACAWTASTKSGSASFTIGAGTGVLNVTAVAIDAVIEVKAAYQSKERFDTVTLVKLIDPPPGSGTGGGTSDSASLNITGQTSSYGSAAGRVLSVLAGSVGQVALAATCSFNKVTNGNTGAFGKWQWRAIGGSWADVAAETASSSNAVNTQVPEPDNTAGSLTVNATKSGLTAATAYEFQFFARSAGAAIDLNGNEAAVGS